MRLKIIVLIIVIAFFFIYLLIRISNKYKFKNIKKTYSLVVCVYNENIDWLYDEKNTFKYKEIYVYIKNKERAETLLANNNESNKIKYIQLPNIGSCDFAYLYHIIKNYDNLTDYICFSKGTFKKTIRTYNDFNYIIKPMYKLNKNEVKNLQNFYLNNWDFKFNKNLNFAFEKSEFKNLEHYLLSIFSKEGVDILFKNYTNIILEGYFNVSKINIHRYDKKIYEKLQVNKGGPNRELDHFHERIWGLLFSNKKKNIDLL